MRLDMVAIGFQTSTQRYLNGNFIVDDEDTQGRNRRWLFGH